MGQDGTQHGLHVVAVLLGRAVGQVGVEVLGFELSDTGILGAHFTQQAFAVNLGDEGTGGFAFRMDGVTGLTALAFDVAVGFAAAVGDELLGRAAAVLLGGHDVERVAHTLHFVGMGSRELGDGVVFLLELTLETGGQNGSFGTALALGELGRHILDRRDGTTEAFAELTAQIGDLHELVTTDGIHVGTHGGQGLHHILVAVVAAATTTAAVAIIPIATTTPGGTHSTTDGATDEGTAPVAHAVVVATDVDSRLETFHEKTPCKM